MDIASDDVETYLDPNVEGHTAWDSYIKFVDEIEKISGQVLDDVLTQMYWYCYKQGWEDATGRTAQESAE